jgi:ribosomal protein L28
VSARCQVTGRTVGFGNTVSHSPRRSRRRCSPNIQTKAELFSKHGNVLLEELADLVRGPDCVAGQMGAKQGGNLVGPALTARDLLMADRAVHEAARHHLRANTPTREPQVVKEVLQAGIVSVPQQQRQDTRGIPSWTAWYDFEPSPSTLPGVQF